MESISSSSSGKIPIRPHQKPDSPPHAKRYDRDMELLSNLLLQGRVIEPDENIGAPTEQATIDLHAAHDATEVTDNEGEDETHDDNRWIIDSQTKGMQTLSKAEVEALLEANTETVEEFFSLTKKGYDEWEEKQAGIEAQREAQKAARKENKEDKEDKEIFEEGERD